MAFRDNGGSLGLLTGKIDGLEMDFGFIAGLNRHLFSRASLLAS